MIFAGEGLANPSILCKLFWINDIGLPARAGRCLARSGLACVQPMPSLRDCGLFHFFPALTCRAFLCRRFAAGANSVVYVSAAPVFLRSLLGRGWDTDSPVPT